jgi:hypothetical protein
VQQVLWHWSDHIILEALFYFSSCFPDLVSAEGSTASENTLKIANVVRLPAYYLQKNGTAFRPYRFLKKTRDRTLRFSELSKYTQTSFA